MFEKLKAFLEKGKSMLEEAFVEPEEDTFVTVPEGVTCEQLIKEAKEYVDAIIVYRHGEDRKDAPQEKKPADEAPDTEEKTTGEAEEEPDEDKNEQEG